MALLNPFQPSPAGVAPTMVAAAGGGDSFHNTGVQQVLLANGGASPTVVTFDAPNPDNFGTIDASHDYEVTVPAGASRWVGPFPTGRFNNETGHVQMSYSSVTDLTVGVMAPRSAA